MADQTTTAAPSAAEDVFRGEHVGADEYDRYRRTGELPARFKTADNSDSAPDDAPEETESEGEEPESAGSPEEPSHTQEPARGRKLSAEERIAQLESTIEKIRKGAGLHKTPPAEPSPARTEQPPPQAQFYTRPKPTVEDRNQDGSPKFAAYEDFVEDLADWKTEQRLFAAQQAAIAQSEAKKLEERVEEARGRHENFDEVKDALLSKLIGSDARPLVPVDVLAMMNDSDYMADLVYTIGSDEKESAQFVKMAKTNPHQAMRYIAKVEALIEEELGKGTETNGKAPERQTRAPKPPSPVGGSSSRAFDVSDESLSPEEWMRKRNSDLARRHKG